MLILPWMLLMATMWPCFLSTMEGRSAEDTGWTISLSVTMPGAAGGDLAFSLENHGGMGSGVLGRLEHKQQSPLVLLGAWPLI